MKKYYLLATALAALVSCSENEFIGDNNLGEANGQAPISFDLNTPAVTRAADKTGSDAAADLNYQFIVWGEKNEADNGTAAGATDLVFKNYQVNYTASTAYTTTSNTKNWEYVGFTHSNTATTDDYQTNIQPSLSVAQTIKYWDFGASKYTFTAVSALPADISTGKVTFTKNTTGASFSDFNKGYEIEVKTGAALDNIFVADRNVSNQGTCTDRTAMNAYGGNATMKFRNFMSKIRFGIYETIPGYKVKITKVHYNNADQTTKFGVDGKFLTVGDGSSTHTKFTVTYENPSNKAIVDVQSGAVTTGYFETAPADEVTSGTPSPQIIVPILSADNIGTTPTTATFDKTEKVTSPESEKAGVYTTILPFTTNDTNIKLQIDYKLISEDTNEEISITGKTAEVPKEYCRWKSNYAYSYLFKITDSDLYPITFDAVEVVDENGLAEYITTVTQPSITTFGVVLNSSSEFQNYVTGKNDYKLPGSTDKLDIYATILQGSTVLTPQLTSQNKANFVTVYAVDYKSGATAAEKAEKPITEFSVANAIEHTGGLITATPILEATNDYFSTAPAPVTTVPGEDGVNKTINAVKLQGVKKAGKYAVEIVTYEAVTLTSGAELNGYYSLSGDTYSKETSGTYSSGTYYKQVKTYKVITVE
jgi:hypothetical protein